MIDVGVVELLCVRKGLCEAQITRHGREFV